MVLSINFEPWTTLIRATLGGSQVGKEELAAYDSACDYYGKERVALQKTEKPVDFIRLNEYKNSTILAFQSFCALRENLKEDLALNKVREFLEAKYNPEANKSLFIHWPEVTVSNEKDESIDLKDLFCRIQLYYKGLSFRECEKLTFMKTTYTKVQWDCGYIHSHTQTLTEPYMQFRHVCLGSGPINNTIDTLRVTPNDEMASALFFWELDKVAHVESLNGVPYYRLNNVTSHDTFHKVSYIERRGINSISYRVSSRCRYFTDFLCSFFRATDIPFAYKDGKYVLGCSFTDFTVMMTNYYRKWRDALTTAVELDLNYPQSYRGMYIPQEQYVISNGKIYTTEGTRRRERGIPSHIEPFRFNEKEFPLVVEPEIDEKDNYLTCTLIKLPFVASVLEFMLTTINTATNEHYEEKQTTQEDILRERFYLSVSSSTNGEGCTITASTSTIN